MKIKVSKHKLNTHYRGSPRGGRTQQHVYCLRYAHSQHTQSHLGRKQQQAKIPIAFLFSKLEMRIAKSGNHLNKELQTLDVWQKFNNISVSFKKTITVCGP